jgi:hypothetical protein
MKQTLLFLSLFTALSVQAFAETAVDFINRRHVTFYSKDLNREATESHDKYFSGQVFKTLTYSKIENNDLRKFVLDQMASSKPQAKTMDNVTLLINMGLGWDTTNIKDQPYYVQDFVNEIQNIGVKTYFFKRYPYSPLEANIEVIKSQLKHLFQDKNKKYLLLSLCKGSLELVVALVELIKENPSIEEQVVGYINMSGMFDGIYLAENRTDLNLIREFTTFISSLPFCEATFKRTDREETMWALSFLTDERINKILSPVLSYRLENIPAINITSAMTSDIMLNRKSPLIPVIKYNDKTDIYPYANDGFLDISQTRLPKSIFPRQKSLVTESTHLISDGFFERYDLIIKENRIKFYKSLYQAIINEIKR